MIDVSRTTIQVFCGRQLIRDFWGLEVAEDWAIYALARDEGAPDVPAVGLDDGGLIAAPHDVPDVHDGTTIDPVGDAADASFADAPDDVLVAPAIDVLDAGAIGAVDVIDAALDAFTADVLIDPSAVDADAVDVLDGGADVRDATGVANDDGEVDAPGDVGDDGASAADVSFADVTDVGTSADVLAFDAGPASPPPRPVAPLSTSTVTSQSPTLRWQLGEGTDGARVELCRDRAMTRSCLAPLDVTGASGRPSSPLAPGQWFWRLTGLVAGSPITPDGPTWQFVVGARTAPRDTSWGWTSIAAGLQGWPSPPSRWPDRAAAPTSAARSRAPGTSTATATPTSWWARPAAARRTFTWAARRG
jgi:hypothetical protein